MHFYKTYGLVVASELVLPELVVASATDAPDVNIMLGPVPETLEGATYSDRYFQVAGSVCHIVAEGVARYRMEEGRRLLVDAEAGVADGDVRLYLLGSALGAVLHQRQCLPLHVSSVVTPNGAWAFTGPSGAGKSTLAASLHYKFGWPLLSDDVAVMLPNCPNLFHPGPSRLKLWQDAIDHLEIESSNLTPDLTRINKFHLQPPQGFSQEARPLEKIIWLEKAQKDEDVTIIPVKGRQALKLLSGAIYRPSFATHLSKDQTLFSFYCNLLQKIKVYRFRRSWSLEKNDVNLLFLHDFLNAI